MNSFEWIFCTGMIRSGSTLQYQLTSDIIERAGIGQREPYVEETEFPALAAGRRSHLIGVFKAHVCTDELQEVAKSRRAAVVYSYRDIRDVAVSAMRKFGFESIEALLNAGWLQQAIVDYDRWTSMPCVHISRYESMVEAVPAEALAINAFLGHPLTEADAVTIGRAYRFEEQQVRVREIAPRDQGPVNNSLFDRHHLLHHNHLHRGEVGAWREVLTSAEKQALHDEFHPWLAATNYSLDE